MADPAPWQTMLREALAVLALPADEQVRVNSPGCVACDLLDDFDHARIVAVGEANLSSSQRRTLEAMEGVVRSMEPADLECFNAEVLRHPAWERLRELAANALLLFGWEGTVVEPLVQAEPGVWRRVPTAD